MDPRIPRRAFLARCSAALALRMREDFAERLGIVCQFEPEEEATRKVLAAARQAGFRRAQVHFPWDRATGGFLRGLRGWLAAEDVRADVVSAYVNCAVPENVLMGARAGDLERAIELAASLGASRLVAWTGGYGSGLMTADERNNQPAATDAICRFIEPRLKQLEANQLILALETYITLVCPDAPALRRLLDRLPPFIKAVLEPPNLTPLERYSQRDEALREMVQVLAGRIGVVHPKDFRLAAGGRKYDLPGPLAGEMNYPLYFDQIRTLPDDIPWIAEHLPPGEFTDAHARIVTCLRANPGAQ